MDSPQIQTGTRIYRFWQQTAGIQPRHSVKLPVAIACRVDFWTRTLGTAYNNVGAPKVVVYNREAKRALRGGLQWSPSRV